VGRFFGEKKIFRRIVESEVLSNNFSGGNTVKFYAISVPTTLVGAELEIKQ